MFISVQCPAEQITLTSEVQVNTLNKSYGTALIKGYGASSFADVHYTSIVAPVKAQAYTAAKEIIHAEVKVADISRDELNAHLAKNKAEVDSVAAEMRREMAEWRAEQIQVLMSLKSEITAINVKLDERFEAQKRSSSLLQWLAGIILAFVALIPAFQGMFAEKKEVTTQPIIVQVPQQPQNQYPK